MMEAEYIALSTAMQDSIPLQTLAPEVHAIVGGLTLSCWTYSKVFEDNNGALRSILNENPARFAIFALHENNSSILMLFAQIS